MAPVVTPAVVLIFPWPHFQAVLDGQPLIGGKLLTYVPSTSTPKASYVDNGFVTSNANPVVLDDQGAATVFLDGFYHLRLTDADDVLLWEVDPYTFDTGAPPMPGTVVTGTTEATVSASPGASVLTVPNMAPAGYRVKGVTSTIVTSFGTSGGLAALAIGDHTLLDRWGSPPTLAAGAQTSQLTFRAGDEPISPVAYSLLISAIGGLMDATGQIHVTVHWSALSADVP